MRTLLEVCDAMNNAHSDVELAALWQEAQETKEWPRFKALVINNYENYSDIIARSWMASLYYIEAFIRHQHQRSNIISWHYKATVLDQSEKVKKWVQS